MSKGTDLVGGLEGDFASKLKRFLSFFLPFPSSFPSHPSFFSQNYCPCLSKKPLKFVVKMVGIFVMIKSVFVSPLLLLLLKKVVEGRKGEEGRGRERGRRLIFILVFIHFPLFSFFFSHQKAWKGRQS